MEKRPCATHYSLYLYTHKKKKRNIKKEMGDSYSTRESDNASKKEKSLVKKILFEIKTEYVFPEFNG